MSDETNDGSLLSNSQQPSTSDLLKRLARYDKQVDTRSSSLRVVTWSLFALQVLFVFAGICSFVWVHGGAYASEARYAGLIAAGVMILLGIVLVVSTAFQSLKSGVQKFRIGLGAVFAETTDRHREAEFMLTGFLSRYPIRTLESLARRVKVEVETITQRMALSTVVGGLAVVVDKLFPGAAVSLSDTITFASAVNLAAVGGFGAALFLHSVRDGFKRLEFAVNEAVENAKNPPQPMDGAKETAQPAIASASESDVVVPIRSRGERQDV